LTVAGAVATVASLTLAGCSSSGGSSDSKTLTVQIQSGQEPLINAFIKVFKKQNPGVTVKTTSVSQTAKNGTNLQVITSSNAPDVAIMPTNSEAYSEATAGHQLASLSGVYSASKLQSRYGDQLANSLKVNGTPYVVSFDSTFYDIVYYNTAMFKQAGITPPSNHRFSSLDELKTASDKLKALGKQPLSIGPADKFQASWMIDAFLESTTTAAQYQNYLTSWQKGTKQTAKFTDSAFTDAVGQIQQMGKDGIFQNGYLGMNVAQSEATFVNQQAGMLLDGSYSPAVLKKDGISFDYDWALLPPVTEGKTMKISTYNGDAYAIPAKAKNPALAKKFLESIMSADGQAQTVTNSAIPAVNDVPKSAYTSLPSQVQAQLADVATNGGAPGWTSVVPGGIGQQLVDPLVQEMLNGNGTPQTIGTAAQAGLEKFLAGN
jgi:raffinose/stachyose/melibiose transport system substrate-binding protein